MSKTKLLKLMKRHNVHSVSFGYSGSGDSGGVHGVYNADTNELVPDDLAEEVENVFEEIVGPDYNNDGCASDGVFSINDDGKLHYKGDHNEYYTESSHTAYDGAIE